VTAIDLLAGPESDKAGPLGLLTIVALGVAVYFLYRSMVRHIKKVPASFDRPEDDTGPPAEPGGAPGRPDPTGQAGPAGRAGPAGQADTRGQADTHRTTGRTSEPPAQ